MKNTSEKSYYSPNIAEINKIYKKTLTNIILPHIYEGIVSLYDQAKKLYSDPSIANIENLNEYGIFKRYLNGIKDLTQEKINLETNRIISNSGCAKWFDNLVKATIKSHVILLTHSNPFNKSRIIENSEYRKIDVENFIHKCYIETAKYFYIDPSIMNNSDSEIRKTKIHKVIKKGIEAAIYDFIPMKEVLEEFLDNKLNEMDYMNMMKDLIMRDMYYGKGSSNGYSNRYSNLNNMNNSDGGIFFDDSNTIDNNGESERSVSDNINSAKSIMNNIDEIIASSNENSTTDENNDTNDNEINEKNSNVANIENEPKEIGAVTEKQKNFYENTLGKKRISKKNTNMMNTMIDDIKLGMNNGDKDSKEFLSNYFEQE